MFEKHLWKSEILSKDRPASLLKVSFFHRCFFKHFACKNQLPGLSISGTWVENGLMTFPLLSKRENPHFAYGTLLVCRISHFERQFEQPLLPTFPLVLLYLYPWTIEHPFQERI